MKFETDNKNVCFVLGFRKLKETPKIGNEFELTGKIDLELEVLTGKEAMLNPAGKGREDPNGLPEPSRPSTSFNAMLNPFKTFKFIITKEFLKTFIIGIIITLIILFFLIMIYATPNYLVKKLLGA